jgi:homoserine dehydrogenase
VAAEKGLEIGAEGTVMSGTPALLLGRHLLRGAGVRGVRGILNGTCNYILTRMEAGLPYEEALAEAQEKGYAEADPTGDVEGIDATGKVVILANLLMGASLRMADVERTGISDLTAADVEEAASAGERWKLIGAAERAEDGTVRGRVRPERVPLSHPLAGVGGATNAVTYSTELLGDVTLVGPGAGRLETGYAVLVDLLEIHRTAAGR